MLVTQRWNPDFDSLTLNFIPFWIQIRGIPMQFLNLGVVDSIVRSLGERMEVDFDEETVSRVQFVHVRINWNVITLFGYRDTTNLLRESILFSVYIM